MRLSTNIENAEDLRSAGRSYYPTQQSMAFVRRVASAAMGGGIACALEGPYGVGKSSLMAFTLRLLSCPSLSPDLDLPRSHFDDKDDPVQRVRTAGGLLPITLTGSAERLSTRVLSGLESFAKQNTPEGRGLKALLSRSNGRSGRGGDALSALNTLAQLSLENNKVGVLLVIDEFGRHIDRMLDVSGEDDLHLLQDIAESTGRADTPLSLIIVQHYGLDHYSSRMMGDRRAEWEKVRGRFRETVLNNTEKDTAYIVAKVLDEIGRGEQIGPKPLRPGSSAKGAQFLRDTEFLKAAAFCRPLHPMTVVLLSRLARILGQQDRTVVGWLTSAMSSGYAEALRARGRGWVYPEVLFDHFFGDSLRMPSNPTFARRLAAVHGAAERIGDDLSNEARTLFRVFAMLGFCSGQGIAADKASALSCLPAQFPFDTAIGELVNGSLLVYRSYRSEYIVWEGSDYDIVGGIDQELSTLALDAASELNRRAGRDVLAHRHFIESGNRRVARLVWLNAGQPAPSATEDPRVLVWLGEAPASRLESSCDVRVCVPVEALESHLRASVVIRRLLNGDANLRDDKVAVREMRLRLDYHEARISTLSEELLASSDLRWELGESRFPSLQKAVTEAMYRAYPRAFVLHNDLVNRDRISGTVSLALRKLIDALYQNPGKEGLGIERFPAERIIYESFLKANGLHRRIGKRDVWGLRVSGTKLPDGLSYVLKEMRQLFGSGSDPVQVDRVVNVLRERPYGVKQYPALLLCVLIILADKDRHELYEGGEYLPHWGPQTLLRMVKTPKRFAILATSESPLGQALMNRYAHALAGESISSSDLTPVAVARAALIRHVGLSDYARRTNTVSESAQAFRRAIRIAKSPGDMLFRTIPAALGYETLPLRGKGPSGYFAKVAAVRESLERADEELLDKFGDVLVDTLKCGSLAEARTLCTDCARDVLGDSRMYHGYEDFVDAVLAAPDANDRAWLQGVVDNGLGIAPCLASWTDQHVAQAEFALRRTLVTMRQASGLLTDLDIGHDEAPFVVFLSGPGSEEDGPSIKKLVSILKNTPRSRRMAVIVDLARTFRDSSA